MLQCRWQFYRPSTNFVGCDSAHQPTKARDACSSLSMIEVVAIETELPPKNAGPSLFETLTALVIASLFSFRFVGLIAFAALLVVLARSRTSWVRWTCFGLFAASFMLPFDLRTTNTSTHHGKSTALVSVLPVFTGHHTAHSMIRRDHPENCTSLIMNRTGG